MSDYYVADGYRGHAHLMTRVKPDGGIADVGRCVAVFYGPEARLCATIAAASLNHSKNRIAQIVEDQPSRQLRVV